MKLKDLSYFTKLVELKNFTAVAQFFVVSQPTVTYAIKRLETEFNTALITRNHSHQAIVITASGEQLYQHATKILNEIKLTNLDMSHISADRLQFGLPPIIGNYFFSKLAPHLTQNHVIDHLDTVESGSAELLEDLKNGKLDIALLGSPAPLTTDNITAKIIKKHNFKIIVAPDSPWANRKQVSFRELADEKFIMLAEGFVHPTVFNSLAQLNQVNPEIVYRTADTNLLKSMVCQNVGIGFLTETGITPADQVIALDLADEPQPNFYISLAQRKTRLLSVEQQKLVAILTEVATQYLEQN